jgi:hypothetical protein
MAATPQQRPRQRGATPIAGRLGGLERGAHASHRDRAVARLSPAHHKPVDDAGCGAGATPAAPRYGTVATSAASTPRRAAVDGVGEPAQGRRELLAGHLRAADDADARAALLDAPRVLGGDPVEDHRQGVAGGELGVVHQQDAAGPAGGAASG